MLRQQIPVVIFGALPFAAFIALAVVALASDSARDQIPAMSPDQSGWAIFGVDLPKGVAESDPNESQLPSFEKMAESFQGTTVSVFGPNGQVIGSKPLAIEVFQAWSNGAGLLLLNWSKPNSGTLSSTRWTFDGIQQGATTKTDLTWVALSSQIMTTDPDERLHPGRMREWQTDESVHVSVAGPLFVFGQFGASTPSVDEQQLPRWQGKYGVGFKIKPWIVDEVQVRGGPTVRSDDSGRPLRGPAGEHSEVFLEAVTKLGLPVVGRLNLEYLNTATPSPTHHERNLFNQEFRLARPLTGGGQVHMGARVRPDDSPVVASWVDRMQLFMGFELKR